MRVVRRVESKRPHVPTSPRPPAVLRNDFTGNRCAPGLVGVVLDLNQAGFPQLTGEKRCCVPNCHNNQSLFSRPTQKPQKKQNNPHHGAERLHTQQCFLGLFQTLCKLGHVLVRLSVSCEDHLLSPRKQGLLWGQGQLS